jgi:excinuclease ABC subunit C
MPEMNEPTEYVFSLAELPLYPHLKITKERFPRVLATRRIADDGAEYFGAFLGKTSVRILIDFLNRVFRLRSCDIDVDGSFPLPCTQYFRKRCIAPCVAEICDAKKYNERVELVRAFLANERERLRNEIARMIEAYSTQLDFERAAEFRDIAASIEEYWKRPRWNVWLDAAVDTFQLEEADGSVRVILVTQRGRVALGSKVFEFQTRPGIDPTRALHDVIAQFYRFHLPREIRVSHDLEGRPALARALSAKFARPVRIVLSNSDRKITTERALARTRSDLELERAKLAITAEAVEIQLKHLFGLARAPRRVEAVDVSHISGSGFVAARSVWQDGRFAYKENRFWLSDQGSELSTLRRFVEIGLAETLQPDLLLVDGGQAQLNAATKALSTTSNELTIIGAVKPAHRHSEISHFLTASGRKIAYDEKDPAMAMLKLLRDDAHDLANLVHRELRDARHFYESSGVTPLIVPTRLVDPDGFADDLRPIVTRDTAARPRRNGDRS